MPINRLLFISFFLLLAQFADAQFKTIRVNVLFDTDKYELKKKEKEKISGCFDTLDAARIKSISLVGHTDSRGDSLYNINLSNNRMNEVDKFLRSIGFVEQVRQKRGFGENKPVADNESDQGMQKNRRVEIQIKYQVEVIRKDTVVVGLPKVKTDTCKGDSVFQSGPGLLFSVDKCNKKKLDCMEIRTINNVEELRRSGLNMRTSQGMQLISDGMFQLRWNSRCGDCKDFEMDWLIAEEEFKKMGFGFYRYNQDSLWDNFPKKRIRKVTINDQKYYCVRLSCSDFGPLFNKDKPFCGNPSLTPIQKIKVPAGWHILSLESDSSARYFYISNYDTTETFDRSNVLKTQIIPNSYICISNDRGDTLVISVNDLTPRKFKFLRKRWIKTHGIGRSGWPHDGFPHVSVTRPVRSGPFQFRKYKLKRSTIRRILRKKK